MNEAETRAKHIDPALKAVGWGVVEGSRIRCEATQRLASLYERKLAARWRCWKKVATAPCLHWPTLETP